MITGVIHLLILIDVSHRGLAARAFFSEGTPSPLSFVTNFITPRARPHPLRFS